MRIYITADEAIAALTTTEVLDGLAGAIESSGVDVGMMSVKLQHALDRGVFRRVRAVVDERAKHSRSYCRGEDPPHGIPVYLAYGPGGDGEGVLVGHAADSDDHEMVIRMFQRCADVAEQFAGLLATPDALARFRRAATDIGSEWEASR